MICARSHSRRPACCYKAIYAAVLLAHWGRCCGHPYSDLSVWGLGSLMCWLTYVVWSPLLLSSVMASSSCLRPSPSCLSPLRAITLYLPPSFFLLLTTNKGLEFLKTRGFLKVVLWSFGSDAISLILTWVLCPLFANGNLLRPVFFSGHVDVCSSSFCSDVSERYLMLRVLSAASLWTDVSFLTACDDGLLVVSHTVNSFEESVCWEIRWTSECVTDCLTDQQKTSPTDTVYDKEWSCHHIELSSSALLIYYCSFVCPLSKHLSIHPST